MYTDCSILPFPGLMVPGQPWLVFTLNWTVLTLCLLRLYRPHPPLVRLSQGDRHKCLVERPQSLSGTSHVYVSCSFCVCLVVLYMCGVLVLGFLPFFSSSTTTSACSVLYTKSCMYFHGNMHMHTLPRFSSTPFPHAHARLQKILWSGSRHELTHRTDRSAMSN